METPHNLSPLAQICPQPIFVIGAPRSGTSILAWSLAQHSQLWTSGETHFLSDFFREHWLDHTFDKAKQMPKSWFDLQGVEKTEFLQSLGVGLNVLFTSRSQGRRWIDQTPAYTLNVNELAEMFPGAMFVHILRDGRRVVHSLMHFMDQLSVQEKTALTQQGVRTGQQSFKEACQVWRHFVQVAMDFGQANPGRCITVVNEQMIANPAACFQELSAFLGIPYEAAPAEYFSTHRLNSSFRPAANDSNWVRRLGEPWTEWTPEQAGIFWLEAGPEMVKYGLAPEPEGDLADLVALSPKNRRLDSEYHELAQAYITLEHWAHELEARLIEQELASQKSGPWARLTTPLKEWRQKLLPGRSG